MAALIKKGNTKKKRRLCKKCRKLLSQNRITNRMYVCSRCVDHTPRRRFQKGKTSAVKSGKTWTLTFEQYKSIIEQPCVYCDGQLGKTISRIGLDRLDNNKGYEKDNVVSCCYSCNSTRGTEWSPIEARKIIQFGLSLRNKKDM